MQEVQALIAEITDIMHTMVPNDPRRERIIKLSGRLNSEKTYQALGEALKQTRLFSGLVQQLANFSALASEKDFLPAEWFIENITEWSAASLEKALNPENDRQLIASGLTLFTAMINVDRADEVGSNRQLLGLSILKRQFPSVEMAVDNQLGQFDPGLTIRQMLRYGDPDLTGQITEVLQRALRQGRTAEVFSRMFKNFNDSGLFPKVEPLIKTQLEIYGLDTVDTMHAWALSTTPENMLEASISCISVLDKLFHADATSIKFLVSEYGIKDFGRYPWQTLLRQYQERDEISKPYGVYAMARDDHNGVFYKGVDGLESLSKQLEGKYCIRIFESGSKLELIHELNKLRHRFGPVAFGIIGGHGRPDMIKIGPDEEGAIKLEDIKRQGASVVSLAFKDKSPIIFVSCSTGKNIEGEQTQEEGMAQQASRVLQRPIIAPGTDTMGIKTINATFDSDGQLHLDAEFWEEGYTKQFVGGKAV